MTSLQAINGYGYGYDPYFMQAYNSPNYLQMLQAQQAQAPQQPQQTQGGAKNTIFQGAPQQGKLPEEPKKKNTLAWCILGAAAIAGTAWCISKGKKSGAEGLWNQFKEGFTGIWKSSNTGAAVRDVNGQKIVNIPGKENIIKGATAADDLAKLGFENGTKFEASELLKAVDDKTTTLAEGIKIKQGTFKVDNGFVTFEGDKVVKFVNSKGDDIMTRYLEPEKIAEYATENKNNKKLIDEMIAGLKDGKKLDEIKGLEIEHTVDDLVRNFTRENPTDDFIFQQAKTNRFHIDSDAVKAYRSEHPEIHDLLRKIEDGKTGVGQLFKAEYNDSKVGTFLIENGDVNAIRDLAGNLHAKGSDRYQALIYDNREIYDNIFKHEKDFTNIVRVLG